MDNLKNRISPLNLIIVFFIVFCVWFSMYYYLVSGALPAEKVADIAVARNNPKECSKIILVNFMADTDTDELVATCYSKVAEEKKDETICNNIKNNSWKDLCVQNITSVKNDMSLCIKIDDQLKKGSCYESFVEQGANMSICATILPDPKDPSELSGSDLCYLGAVERTHDASLCTSKIQTGYYRNWCYDSVARNTGNISLCDKMQGDYAKSYSDSCKSSVKAKSY